MKKRCLITILFPLLLCSCGDIIYNAKIGNIERIQAGLDSGVPIDKRDHIGYTPLMWATVEGRYAAMEYLCTKGADINARSNDGATALILAVYYRDGKAVETLMRFNPDKTIRDKHGNTAMYYAEQWYNPAVIALLK